MGTTEVQRTLVKSPPELWSELSDQGSLGRLLSDLGEVRIVSTVADSAVYWEGDEVTGSALIKQAGWGTKVTLTVTLATPETSPAVPRAGPGGGRRPRGVAHPPHGRRAARDRRAPITSTGERAYLVDSGAIPPATGARAADRDRDARPPWDEPRDGHTRSAGGRRRPGRPAPRAPRCPTRLPPALTAADRTSEDGRAHAAGLLRPAPRTPIPPARGAGPVPRANRREHRPPSPTRNPTPPRPPWTHCRRATACGRRRSQALPPPRRLCPRRASRALQRPRRPCPRQRSRMLRRPPSRPKPPPRVRSPHPRRPSPRRP